MKMKKNDLVEQFHDIVNYMYSITWNSLLQNSSAKTTMKIINRFIHSTSNNVHSN